MDSYLCWKMMSSHKYQGQYHWNVQLKFNICYMGRSWNFHPSFRGGLVSFVPIQQKGLDHVFFIHHISKYTGPPTPLYFLTSLLVCTCVTQTNESTYNCRLSGRLLNEWHQHQFIPCHKKYSGLKSKYRKATSLYLEHVLIQLTFTSCLHSGQVMT